MNGKPPNSRFRAKAEWAFDGYQERSKEGWAIEQLADILWEDLVKDNKKVRGTIKKWMMGDKHAFLEHDKYYEDDEDNEDNINEDNEDNEDDNIDDIDEDDEDDEDNKADKADKDEKDEKIDKHMFMLWFLGKNL